MSIVNIQGTDCGENEVAIYSHCGNHGYYRGYGEGTIGEDMCTRVFNRWDMTGYLSFSFYNDDCCNYETGCYSRDCECISLVKAGARWTDIHEEAPGGMPIPSGSGVHENFKYIHGLKAFLLEYCALFTYDTIVGWGGGLQYDNLYTLPSWLHRESNTWNPELVYVGLEHNELSGYVDTNRICNTGVPDINFDGLQVYRITLTGNNFCHPNSDWGVDSGTAECVWASGQDKDDCSADSAGLLDDCGDLFKSCCRIGPTNQAWAMCLNWENCMAYTEGNAVADNWCDDYLQLPDCDCIGIPSGECNTYWPEAIYGSGTCDRGFFSNSYSNASCLIGAGGGSYTSQIGICTNNPLYGTTGRHFKCEYEEGGCMTEWPHPQYLFKPTPYSGKKKRLNSRIHKQNKTRIEKYKDKRLNSRIQKQNSDNIPPTYPDGEVGEFIPWPYRVPAQWKARLGWRKKK